MTKDEKIKELENKLTIIQEAIEELKRHKFPIYGDRYWYLNLRNIPCIDKYFLTDVDMSLQKVGNFFKTEEEAKKELYKRILIQELKEFADYEPDWDDLEYKFYIFYEPLYNKYDLGAAKHYRRIGEIYFNSRGKAEEAIKHFGDRLKVLF